MSCGNPRMSVISSTRHNKKRLNALSDNFFKENKQGISLLPPLMNLSAYVMKYWTILAATSIPLLAKEKGESVR